MAEVLTDLLQTREEALAALDGEESTARVDALLDVVESLRTGHLDRQHALCAEAKALAEHLGYEEGRMGALGLEGRILYFRSDYDGAATRLTEAYCYFERIGEERKANEFRSLLALVWLTVGQYEAALEIALENLAYARRQGDVEAEAWVLQGLSGAYLELGDLDRAFDYGLQALERFTGEGHRLGQARAHSSVGGALQQLNRLDEAEAHHEISLALFREVEDRLGESRALYDLGLAAHVQSDHERARSMHEQALALRRELQNRQAVSSSLLALGETLLAMGATDAAVAALEEALATAEALALQPRIFPIHRALADAYEARGDYERALHHHRQFHLVCETTLGAQAAGRIHTLQIRHDVERAQQEAEIERLRNVELRETNDELQRTLAELKRMQARLVQSEKLAGIGRFTAGIAHEIKNPLNFVVNFAQLNAELAEDLCAVLLARRGEVPTDLADELEDGLRTFAGNVGKVLDHARRADGIVKSMLGHVRSTGGERRPVDLHPVLDQSIENVFGGRAGDGTVEVERHYGNGVRAVEIVTQSMQRVFVNVLDNARYAVLRRREIEGDGFTPRIEVRTRALPGLVRVSITDNGPGIPAENCTRVFEPFFTTKPTGEGTGLGLSLSYDIVTQGHDGTMVAISDEGQGATFSITLPAASVGDGAA